MDVATVKSGDLAGPCAFRDFSLCSSTLYLLLLNCQPTDILRSAGVFAVLWVRTIAQGQGSVWLHIRPGHDGLWQHLASSESDVPRHRSRHFNLYSGVLSAANGCCGVPFSRLQGFFPHHPGHVIHRLMHLEGYLNVCQSFQVTPPSFDQPFSDLF